MIIEDKEEAILLWEQIRMQAISRGMSKVFVTSRVPTSRIDLARLAVIEAGGDLDKIKATGLLNMLALSLPMGLGTSLRIDLIENTIQITHRGGDAATDAPSKPWRIGVYHPMR